MKNVLFLLAIIAVSCSAEERASNANDADSESIDTEMAANDSDAEESDILNSPDLGEQIVTYAVSLKGVSYKVAGKDTSGFDCSGFVYYVYKKHNIDVPPSSRHLAELGAEVEADAARPGDLVFFKGTNLDNPEVGHVGIVVSKPGDPVKFIHASSATNSAYVKFDSLAKPNYNRRFLKIKRILTDIHSDTK